MGKIKAIVLKINENNITVLEDTGEFKTMRWSKPAYVGQEITWYDYREYIIYTLTALFLFVLATLMFYFLITSGRV